MRLFPGLRSEQYIPGFQKMCLRKQEGPRESRPVDDVDFFRGTEMGVELHSTIRGESTKFEIAKYI